MRVYFSVLQQIRLFYGVLPGLTWMHVFLSVLAVSVGLLVTIMSSDKLYMSQVFRTHFLK
jgi:hypothetical protein